ncbi:Flp pilus assembly protein CpaB [Sinorhizobium alkalisoli]|uniref:Flp pilus assembly protein CpaB n=1 Tax=Sinorhizobium alkalisoli TaxID=1752398 RepID=A0A1E3VBL3_9HYPH|nr:Flp pilus assembly protein CpaB [Sinorhizobium alkalisoli]MCA1490052.1 Flp pilus assembly protein CpaB [Ensifer sp. NBAIM29]MCG5481656.1 Flp pilus assembly protein CpaB [Sinorhizobium alkalisoli]ODR90246.1 Flp pilus assembly protein CpaB [Sinorhizobium alkalisoli]QFI68252.1 Flp pilus assembly protein RcpC/CpaB [Sinorhizobium alkalisoli]
MKPVRIIILAVAVGSAAMAGLLVMKLTRGRAPQIAAPVIEREPTINVLVASKSLPVGARLGAESIRWMAWPKDNIAEGMITEENRPAAVDDLSGAVVRLPIFNGEPVRPEKIADASNRIMSSLLPAGKRAVATEITVATGAGGFILPNDRVDVIMVRKSDGNGLYLTETVLSNVRVLAIDQQVEVKEDGSKSVLGTTATLELTPEQSKVMTVAQQMAERISLALRSVADAQEPDTVAADYLLSGDGQPSIQVIKSGSIVKTDGAIQNQR